MVEMMLSQNCSVLLIKATTQRVCNINLFITWPLGHRIIRSWCHTWLFMPTGYVVTK